MGIRNSLYRSNRLARGRVPNGTRLGDSHSRTALLGGALVLIFALILSGCDRTVPQTRMAPVDHPEAKAESEAPPVIKTDADWKKLTNAQWRKRLTPAQYHILREQGTEIAFTGPFWNSHEKATYVCAGCGLELFSSDQKFDSGTGWPSFWAPIRPGAVAIATDNSYGMSRDEVSCSRCGGHLGHVFDDGPPPTGKRYCIDGYALKQIKRQ